MASPHWLYILHLAGRKGWPDIRVYGIDHTFDTGHGMDNWRQRIVDDVSFACDRQQMVEKLLALPDIAADMNNGSTDDGSLSDDDWGDLPTAAGRDVPRQAESRTTLADVQRALQAFAGDGLVTMTESNDGTFMFTFVGGEE